MKYVQDHSLAAGNISVPCLACGKMVRLCDAIIDLDGPAFKAYYHEKCATSGPVAPCEIFGCARPNLKAEGANV